MTTLWHKIAAVLMIALVLIALVVVRAQYRARTLTTALAEAQTAQHKLETDYRQLQLERAQWSSAARIEKMAREQLKMAFPDATRTIHIAGAPEKKAP